MGLFICFSKHSRYKLPKHTKIETELVDKFGFQEISQDFCNMIVQLILKVSNVKGETFCRFIDEEGNSRGISTANIAGHTSGNETVLILSTRDNIEEIVSGDDIRAILTFNYEDDENINLDINILCSNQVTKLGGGKILVTHLIDICRQEEIQKITLFASDSAASFYEKFGFVNSSERYQNMMSLRLAGNKKLYTLKKNRRKNKTKNKKQRNRTKNKKYTLKKR